MKLWIMYIYKIFCHLITFFLKLYFKFLFGKKVIIGRNFQIRKGFTLLLDDEGMVSIGDNVFFNNFCTVCALNEIVIGDGTIFGENIKIYDHNHKYSDPSIPIKQQGYSTAPIHIGKHCWIGSNVIILKGVTIGDNSVIGAGCVIYKDVPANSVVINKQNLEIHHKLL